MTSHDNYHTVLTSCNVSRLEDVCPRDLRQRFPKNIENNTLTILHAHPDHIGFTNFRYQLPINNLHFYDIPKADLQYYGYRLEDRRLMAEHQAYIRHAESALRGKVRGSAFVIRTLETRWTMFGRRRDPAYWTSSALFTDYTLFSDKLPPPCSVEEVCRKIRLLTGVWSKDTIIESVEFMRLRAMLGGWITVKLGSTPLTKGQEKTKKPKASRVKRVLRRVAQRVGAVFKV